MSQKLLREVWAVAGVMVVGVLAAAGIAYAQTPTLSQTSVTVGVDQSATVTSENNIDVYMDSNSASNVVSTAVNGTQITMTGITPGTATLTLCQVGTVSDCVTLSVTVQTQSTSGLSLSSNNLSLAINGNQSVTISGGDGTYSVSSNSNTGVASTNLSGGTLTVSGLATGSATIDICDTTGGVCGTLSVTVSSSSTSSLSFSGNNLSIAPGGNQSVTISGGDGIYTISNNSNSSVVSVGISSGNSLVIDAINSGSATITVCDTSSPNICGTLSLTVTGSTGTTQTTSGQAVTFSTNSPTIQAGQTLNVTISGSALSYFISSNESPNVVQATISNATALSLYAETAGTDSVTVCATGGAGCSQLSITVTGSTSNPTPTITTTPTTVVTTPTTVGSVVANASLLAEIQSLQTAVTQALAQIQSIQTQLNQVEAQVSAGSGNNVSASVSSGTSSSSDFTELLTVGSEDAQVTMLQQELTSLGFYSGPITGYYGTLTQQAVIKYQTQHGIEATGEVGPETRAALNGGN